MKAAMAGDSTGFDCEGILWLVQWALETKPQARFVGGKMCLFSFWCLLLRTLVVIPIEEGMISAPRLDVVYISECCGYRCTL